MKFKLKYFLCLEIIFASLFIKAQNPQTYTIIKYTTDNGLLQNSVRGINVDKNGYCWLTTEAGLARFDGSKFKYYNRNNFPKLQTAFFTRIIQDEQKNMYCPELLGSCLRIVDTPNKASYAEYIELKSISRIIGKPFDYNLIVKLVKENITDASQEKIDWQSSIVSLGINEVYFIFENKVWYIKGNNIKPIVIKDEKFSFRNSTLLGSYFIQILKGNKVIVLENGIVVPNLNKIEGDILSDSTYLQGNYSLDYNNGKSYVICNRNIYELIFENGKLNTKLILKDLNIKRIACVCYNKNENLYFIGSLDEGLAIVRPSQFTMKILKEDNPNINSYYSQVRLPDQCILTNNHKFYYDGIVKPFNYNTDNQRVKYCYENNKLWITYFDTLKCYKYPEMEILNTTILPLNPSAIQYNLEDSCLYVLTQMQLSTIKNFKRQTIISDSFAMLNKLQLISLLIVDKERVLVGSNKFIFEYSRVKGTFTIKKTCYNTSLYMDNDRDVWFSTANNGFGIVYNGEYKLFPLDKEQKMGFVYNVFVDMYNNVWLTTNFGLFRIQKSDLIKYLKNNRHILKYEVFNTSDGLLNNEFNGGGSNSICPMPNGMLSITSSVGLAWLNTAKIMKHNTSSQIYLDEIFVNDSAIESSDNFKVPYNFSKLEINISSPFFGNEFNNNTYYRIKEISPLWEKIDRNTKIVLNLLPKGEYVIELSKLNNKSEATRTIKFTVLPHMLESRPFIILYIIIAIGLLYLLYKWRLKVLSQQKKQLELSVLNRTNELNINLNQLEKTIVELKLSEERLFRNGLFKDKVSGMILHDIRSPLRFLSSVASNLHLNHNHLEPFVLEKQLNELATASTNLYYFSNDFLEWIKAQNNNYILKIKKIELNKLFDELYNMFYSLAKYKNNSIIIEKNSAYCITDLNVLRIILRNLMDNANKYTNNGIINLSADITHSDTIIKISDNGPGISESLLNELSSNFKDDSEINSNTLGLKMVIELIKLLNGKIEINSQLNIGTNIEITFPN